MSHYTPTDLEAFVRQRSPEICQGIQRAASRSRNEADLVAEVEDVLRSFERNFDLTLHLARERTLINGRADAVYNRFVIEYEPPKSLRKQANYRHNQHAIDQVKQYMEELSRLDRHRKERLAGVVLDGYFFIFIRHRDEHWHIDDPIPVTPHSTETFLRYLLSLSTELALTPENLVRDFGENTIVSRLCVRTLYEALGCSDCPPRVNILFRQWQRQFGEITGWEKQSRRLNLPQIAREFGINEPRPDPLRFFFSIHTYYATFIKLLAVQIATYYLIPKVGSGLSQVASSDSQALKKYLSKLEHGGIFADFGIKNFLEGDFFGWYLDVWDEHLDTAIRRLISDLANYSLVTLDVDPEETRDLLKQLYQNLMPKTLRHALGEYYTPDWLAERLLNQLGYNGDPNKRILDPACGSGTFLVLIIKRIHQYQEEKMLPPSQVLEKILDNVVGFDLNPLAVISARTNYLLALGDLLQHRQGDVNIPIYLADSILTPTAGSDLFTQHMFSFNTAVGKFSVPRALVDARYIDELAYLLEQSVNIHLTPDQFTQKLVQKFPLDENTDSLQIEVAINLYEQLLSLEEQGINGIWARIIKNAFAPLFQGKFDYVVGNPPWINWESLPDEYRIEIAPLWADHNLFPHKGFDAILGKSKDDISVLMTYISIDKYLKDKGLLGFLITQSVFKTVGGGKGFRRFKLGDGTPLRILGVDDMASIKPFEGASNRTSAFVLEKNNITKYPINYNFWYKPDGGIIIPEKVSLNTIISEKIATYHKFVAMPIDENDITSSWITGKQKAIEAIKNIQGPSDYTARVGICCWLNGVFWLEVLDVRPDGFLMITNFTEGGKQKIEKMQTVIEPDLVYPLLRGRDIDRWLAIPNYHILVTHEKGAGLKAISEEIMATKYTKTFSYLKYFEDKLRKRSGFSRYFKNTDPFYSCFNIGDYSFSSYKVVWQNIGSSLNCAVVSEHEGKVVIPQHIVTLIPFSDESEAHYLCSLMNSSPVNFTLQSYSQKGGKSFGTPHVLEYINIPKFDKNDSIHNQLSDLSKEAHKSKMTDNKKILNEIENEIDVASGKLFSLNLDQIKDIQDSI
jgi:SAM-dependent methyltransferase